MRYTYDQPDYLDKSGLIHLVEELRTLIEEIVNGNLDVSKFATKEELNSAVSSIDLSEYATRAEIPSLDGYATKSYVDENIADVATNGEIDLSNYVTKDIVYTKEETDALIPSTEGLATTEYVDNAVSNVPTTDLTGYATEEYVSTAISNIPATDLSNYYTKSEVDALIGGSTGGDSGETEGGDEVIPPTVTMAFTSSSTTVKCGFNRTIKVGYIDAGDNDVTDNYDTVFSISDNAFDSSLLTLTDNGNTVTLYFEDEDIIGETFTLNAVDSGKTCTPITLSMELVYACIRFLKKSI